MTMNTLMLKPAPVNYFFSLIAVALFCFLAPAQGATAQDMKSIDDFLKQEVEVSSEQISPAQVEFIGLRCSALYLILSQFSIDNGRTDESKKFRKVSEAALQLAMESNVNRNEDYASGQLKIMVGAYVERWQKSKALTGNFFEDEVISADLKTCGEVF